jgi:hypothetical protein
MVCYLLISIYVHQIIYIYHCIRYGDEYIYFSKSIERDEWDIQNTDKDKIPSWFLCFVHSPAL